MSEVGSNLNVNMTYKLALAEHIKPPNYIISKAKT